MISQFILPDIIQNIEIASKENRTDYFCSTRDVFQARLDSFILRTNKYLLSAVIGEIGNNTFDHNWEYEAGKPRGVYFSSETLNQIVLADFGRGIKKSLSTVKKCDSDIEAIKIAFTERISGRSPEQRGNGLKFVLETVKDKNWFLYFQSGNACCIIDKSEVTFKEVEINIPGCLAIIRYGEK